MTTTGFNRPASVIGRNNAFSVFLMGALPAVAGSAISFLLAGFLVWGAVSLVFRRFAFRMTEGDRLLAWTFTAFVGFLVITGLMGENGTEVLRSLWLVPFLSAWVLIPRLRHSPEVDYLQLYILGAAVGCIGALALAAMEFVFTGTLRAEGGAGNSVVFAGMCLCLAGIAGLLVNAPTRRLRLLAVGAVCAGLIAAMLSMTRGVILAIPLVMILLFVYAHGRRGALAMRLMVLGVVAGTCLALYGLWDVVQTRIDFTTTEITGLVEGKHTASMGERMRLWRGGVLAFLDSPWWGHGVQNRMDVLVPYLRQDGLPLSTFTHPHNGYLAVALDGGLIVLVSLIAVLAVPAVVAWRAPRDANYRRRLFLALILSACYAVIAMTQILFKHDIMDSFFIFTAIVVAASIPDRKNDAPPLVATRENEERQGR